MSQVVVHWYGESVKKNLNKILSDRLTLATNGLKEYIRNRLSIICYMWRHHSAPGEFPRLESGDLKSSAVAWQETLPGTIAGHVGAGISTGLRPGYSPGSELDYAATLELRKRRSFLRRGLREFQPTILRILLAPPKTP